MTTIITIETHDCPVAVLTVEDSRSDDDLRRVNSIQSVESFVPAHSQVVFHVSAERSIGVRALPESAVDLSGKVGPTPTENTPEDAPANPGDEVAGDCA